MPASALRHRRTPMLAVLITLGLLSAPVLVPPAGARSSQSTPSAPRASMPDPTPGVIRVTASRIDDQYRRRPFSRMYAIELDHDIRAYRFVRDASGRMLDAWRPHWEKLAHLADPITHALKEPQNAGPKTEVLVRHYDYPNASTRHPTTISRPSVEPGKRYEVRFEYRQAGVRTVPVRITETGYSHGRRVQRTSLLQYSDEGVLTHIDGPRPGTDDLLRVEMSPQSGDIVQVAREDRPFDLRVYDGLGHEVPVNRISWLYSALAWYQDTVAPGGYPMAGVVVPQRDDSGIRLEIDDFNRIVRADSPDTGATVYTYDESDRVMEVREADGAHARYEHDAYDRLVRRSLAAQGGPAEVTRYQYFGPWLVGVDAPHVMERYTYDEQYRLEQRDVDIRINGAPRDIHFRTRYHYTGTSRRPVGLTLPGGARLDYSGTPDDVRVGAGNFEVNTRSAWLPGAPAGHATPAGRHGEPDTDPGTDAPMLYRRVTGTRDGQDVQAWHFGNGTGRDATFDRRYGLTLLRDGSNPSRAASDYLRFAMYRRFGQHRQLHRALLGTYSMYQMDERNRLHIAQEERSSHRIAPDGGVLPGIDSSEKTFSWWYDWDANGNRTRTAWEDRLAARSPEAMRAARQAAARRGDASAPAALPTYNGTGVSALEYTQKTSYVPGTHRIAGVRHDASGRMLDWNGWSLDWHPGGVISQMRHQDGRQVRYFYNHQGERIARQEGSDWRFYDYADGRLQTEERLSQPRLRHWWYQDQLPVLLIEAPAPASTVPDRPGHATPASGHAGSPDHARSWSTGGNGTPHSQGAGTLATTQGATESAGDAWRVQWFHLDSRGFPYALTNEQGEITWALASGPFGEILPAVPLQTEWPRKALPDTAQAWRDADPLLRFPMQWADGTTGLNSSPAGDYDPFLGRYLQPSPTARPGENPYLFSRGYPLQARFEVSPDTGR